MQLLPSPCSRHATPRRYPRLLSLVGIMFAPRTCQGFTDSRWNQRRVKYYDSTTKLQQSGAETTVVILYNKPPNVITSHSSGDSIPKSAPGDGHSAIGRMTVYEDVMSMVGFVASKCKSDGDDDKSTQQQQHQMSLSFEEATGIRAETKLHAIGRLDADTTGLLLLTNDGGLVHRVTNPTAVASASASASTSGNGQDTFKKLVTKTYEALIMGHHEMDSPGMQRILNDGVDLGKYGKTKPAIDLRVLSHPTAKSTLVEITIAEGKNRQIRRTFHAIGSGVMKLKRMKVGNELDLGDLREGQWRILCQDEVERCLGWKVRFLEEGRDTFRRRKTGRRSNKRSEMRKGDKSRRRR